MHGHLRNSSSTVLAIAVILLISSGSPAGGPLDAFDAVPVSPGDGETGVAVPVHLEVSLSGFGAGTGTVTFYGRPVSPEENEPFSIIVISDTQYYTAALYGGQPWMFREQAGWIVDNRAALNTAFVAHLGDCVQHGDSYPVEWENSWSAMRLLEGAGIPYSVSVGDNDQTPEGEADGSTALYDQFYGPDHFSASPWYGGHYGGGGDDHFALFSASGREFISISLEYDTSPDDEVLGWADSLLQAHPDRWGIVCSHHILNDGDPATFGWQGMKIYLALYHNPNLFLMLSGHMPGEGRWSADLGDRWIHALMADYQWRDNGGDEWLRILTYYPASKEMGVRTYSPLLDIFESDADSSSQFTLPVDLEVTAEGQSITVMDGVRMDGLVSTEWPGLSPQTEYEWYVEVDDGDEVTRSDRWRFVTGESEPADAPEFAFDLISGNPVKDTAVFSLELARETHVTLAIYDAAGRRVDVVASGTFPEGAHEFQWGGRTPGVYLANLRAGGEVITKKVVVIK